MSQVVLLPLGDYLSSNARVCTRLYVCGTASYFDCDRSHFGFVAANKGTWLCRGFVSQSAVSLLSSPRESREVGLTLLRSAESERGTIIERMAKKTFDGGKIFRHRYRYTISTVRTSMRANLQNNVRRETAEYENIRICEACNVSSRTRFRLVIRTRKRQNRWRDSFIPMFRIRN